MRLISSRNPVQIAQNLLCRFLLIVLVLTQVVSANVAYAASADLVEPAVANGEITEVYDLIVVVVDTALDKDLSSYAGLRNDFPGLLKESTLGERVVRYAEDLRSDNDMTDVRLLFFDRNKETVVDLANALENLYTNGDGTHDNRLTGVVLVGDVPLPIVNKSGNRFVSMFPYTDFENKAYLYNSKAESFEPSPSVAFPKPEIWHGVIRAPGTSAADREELATFLDKNHLYYEDVPEYAKFDKKLFYADLVTEEKNINESVYAHYVKYLAAWEDLAYMRYNKYWANELTGNVLEDLPINEDHEGAAAYVEALNNNPLVGIPDIYSKNIIDQFLIPYYKVLTPYLSRVNDFAENTGRYLPVAGDKMPVDNVPVILGIKDEYTKTYLRDANEAIEKSFNEVISKIEEPMPLLETAVLSGKFTDEGGDDEGGDDEAFSIDATSSDILGIGTVEEVFMRYLYKNEVTSEYYLNGVNAAILETAKQCSVYLGSTKSEYFDENNDFNPAAVDGEYSILTRSIRSDDPRTAATLHSVGVNTRLLSPEEANSLTNNKSSYGAVIEDNPDYGISAFIDNPINPKYVNPLENVLKRGDVIVSVNGQALDYTHSFEQAIEDSYQAVYRVVDTVNNGDESSLNNFQYEILTKGGASLAGKIFRAAGMIGVEYYRGGTKAMATFTFSVDKNGLMAISDPEKDGSGPEVLVVLADKEITSFDFDAITDGAIFALYDTGNQGFSRKGYDNSAGCNLNSASKNSDRCFYPLATMPVLDPAGSTAPVKVSVPGEGEKLMFPENVQKNDLGLNSGDAADFAAHMNIFQFPENRDYEEVDEVYYDSCYAGTPSVMSLTEDSNPYEFPLDPASIGGIDYNISDDLFGALLDSIGAFINSNGDDNKVSPNKETVWNNLDALDAGDIRLNTEGQNVTLKFFSDRYGLFDGIDNNGNGVRDFQWTDEDGDGVYETRLYDFAEAIGSDGQFVNYIPSENIGEISRKMLSHPASFMIPAHPLISPYDRDVTLTVGVETYGKNISSIVLHNEPTAHTIYEQVNSQVTFSLPIDDPRYVSFISSAAPLPDYPAPQPVDQFVDVGGILERVNNGASHYFPGSTVKIEYPNLFALDNYAQLQVELDQKAWALTQVYGSYKILGPEVIDCRPPIDQNNFANCKEIHDEILNKYLSPSINGPFDDPITGFDLEKASGEKIVDALVWKNLSIDDKHQYILEKYLNPDKNAFVNDATLLPSQAGYETGFGYEAAYLVLDGEGDHFDMKFNKDLPEEDNELFSPLSIASGIGSPSAGTDGNDNSNGGGNGGTDGGAGGNDSSGGSGDELIFVDLDQFIKETTEFVEYFTNEPKFSEACSYANNAAAEAEAEKNGTVATTASASDLPLAKLELLVNKNSFAANGTEKVEVEVRGIDKNGNLIGHLSDSGLITLKISQDENTPAFGFNDSVSKSLVAGKTYYSLISNSTVGSATLSVSSSSGISSNPIQIVSLGSSIEIFGSVDNQPSDEVVADGESIMTLEAQVFGSDKKLDQDTVQEVKFTILNEETPDLIEFEGPSTVNTENGAASVQLKAGTKAGSFTVKTEVLTSAGNINPGYPVTTRDFRVVPGEVASISINSDSSVLVANNQSKTTLDITLKDRFGNIANNTYAQVALFVNDEAYFDPTADTNSQIIGTQISTLEGETSLDLFARDKTGSINVIALLLDFDLEEKFIEVGDDWEQIDFSQYVGNSKDFNILDNVDLKLTLDKNSLPADGQSVAKLRTELVHNGAVVSGYSGAIEFTLLNPNGGSFVNLPPKTMNNGILHEANVRFQSSTLAGESEILIDVPGFASSTATIQLLPGAPSQLQLTSSEDSIMTGGDNNVIVEANILDKYGNLVTSDNSTLISFATTDATSKMISFVGAKNAVALNGVASTIIKGGTMSGVANIIASSGELQLATISLDVVKRVDSKDVEKFAPRALYTSLLGGSFGDLATENNLAQTMVNSGQVQAVTSVTATPNDSKRLIGVDGFGKIDILSDSVNADLVLATDNFPYQKVVFSDALADEELGEMFLVPKPEAELFVLEPDVDIPMSEGIFVQRHSTIDPAVEIFSKEGEIFVQKNGETKMKIDEFGRISLNDDRLELKIPKEGDGFNVSEFSILVIDRGENLAMITFRQSFVKNTGAKQNVIGLLPNSTATAFSPGVYFRMSSLAKKYDFVPSFSGYSSDNPRGLYLIDNENEIDSAHAPGLPFTSLERAGDTPGLGFAGDNKHMLLFAGGNSVGEANVPYASEVGINFGDPNVRLKMDGVVGMVSELSGYSRDIGKPLFTGDQKILEMIEFDYNGDDSDDILLVYEDGMIRLLQREISNKRFKDKGYILNVYGGILSTARIDVNKDGFDDLMVGTKESCKEGEVCLSLFTNNGGDFERKTVNLLIEGKPKEMKAFDMNFDGCEDLVVGDTSANIRIFYNKKTGQSCSGIEENFGDNNSFNFGYGLDSGVNMKDNLFINYPGMAAINYEKDTYASFVIRTETPPANLTLEEAGFAADGDAFQALLTNPDAVPRTYAHELDFVPLGTDGKLGISSNKQAVDANGGKVAVGDKINYLITLKNTSGTPVNGLMLSDLTPLTMDLDLESLKCLDSGCTNNLVWRETGTSTRSHVIDNITVPAGGTRTISYSMNANIVPDVHFDIGSNFKRPDGSNIGPNDAYPDIRVRPTINPDGTLIYLASTGSLNGKGQVNYSQENVAATGGSGGGVSDEDLDLISDFSNLDSDLAPGDVSPELQSKVQEKLDASAGGLNADSDYNGCVDSWAGGPVESYESTAEGIAQEIEGLASAFRCSGGGCLPIPYNYVFFAPDDAIPGIAMVAFGVPNPVGFAPMYPSTAPSSVRLYVNPTLTLGLGTSVCVGQPPGGMCYAFALPISAIGGCPDFLGPINDAIAEATNFSSDPDTGLSTVVSDGSSSGGTESVTTGGNFGSSDSPISGAASANIRIPGFPAVITNWIDKQTDEIYGKLLDLPDFYFIYPDGASMMSNMAKGFENVGNSVENATNFQSLSDVLNAINTMPIVQIEGKEVLVKLPSISKAELDKYKQQAQAWIDYEESQLKSALETWKCDESQQRRTLCDAVTVDMIELISSIKKLMDKLDQIAKLPNQILDYRHAESKYATQIICYLDAVMQANGGYIRKQQNTVDAWMKAIEDVIRTVKQWKVILNLMADYQESCDECKNDRFSKLGLMMELFVAIPEPPIIPIPKWPDIIFDVSQVKMGTKILWPDVVFKPEPIVLPNLPTIDLTSISLPDADINIELPGFEIPSWILDFPDFVLPNLPNLPPLPIPDLPDLPRPPKIPQLPNLVSNLSASLKPAIKILCLLKKGLVPIPEGSLATEIETLTQPSVQTVLPIIKNFGMQMPAIKYDYVKQIRVDVKIDMGIDTNFIYEAVKYGADQWNEGIEILGGGINDFTGIPWTQIINVAIQKGVNEASTPINRAIEEVDTGVDAVTSELDSGEPSASLYEDPALNQVIEDLSSIEGVLNDYIANLDIDENYPETFNLIATERYLDPADPLLNRTLAEVEQDILYQDLPDSPGMRQMADLRDSMIAYTKDLDQSNQLLEEIEDFNSFSKILVDNDRSLDRIASLSQPVDVGGGQLKTSFLGEAAESLIKEEAFSGDTGKLIAAALDVPVSEAIAKLGSNSAPVAAPKGFYIIVEDQNESILSYTSELGAGVQTLFIDVDEDDDTDIVYSMGSDVYLKTNYKNAPSMPKGDVVIDPGQSAVSDFVVDGGDSVQGVASPYENHETVDVSWLPKDKNTIGYEVVVRASLSDSYDDAIERVIAITKPLAEVDVDLDGEKIIELSNPELPNITLEIENGNYYVSIFALDENGDRSLASYSTVVAPQECADKESPFPAVTSAQINVPIFKSALIDASNSFDPSGEVAGYYIKLQSGDEIWSDLNVGFDDDGDGIIWNDRTNPRFSIGPFNDESDIGLHEVTLYVVDQAGNSASQKININVFVPSIELDETFSRTGVASGSVGPVVDKMPFSLMRSRYIYRVIDGGLKLVPNIDKVTTSSTSVDGKYLTLSDGTYEISDFDLDDMILVKNADGTVVAEIDPETGNIEILIDGYVTVVNPSVPPSTPTSIDIVGPDGKILVTIYVVADQNIDVEVFEGVGFDAGNVGNMNGVNVSDINIGDAFEFRKIPGDDPNYPGGVVLFNISEDKEMAIIDTAGNIILLDIRMKMSVKENDHTVDPLVIELRFEGAVVAEVYISVRRNATIVGPNDVPFATPNVPSDSIFYGSADQITVPFVDFDELDDDLKRAVIDLYRKDILDGVQTDEGLKLNPDDQVSRAEFVKILLNMLCIIPRPEAYKAYSPNEVGGGFSDITYKEDLDWYYPYVKEAALLGLIQGYRGEPNAAGLVPFKADDTISRAEATKIILEALELREVIDLSSVQIGDPWYVPFVLAAQELTPFMSDLQSLKNNFVITSEEAAEPEKEMTRGELIIMATRVLEVYNCFEIDNDADGMSDFCEEKYDISDPNADLDDDGLINTDECFYGTDPRDGDTDKGGVLDGDEVGFGTDPLNPLDDPDDTDGDGLTDAAEILIHGTDPNDPDTDDGGVSDGDEVANYTNPLDPSDDFDNPGDAGGSQDGESGIYVVPAECNICPCPSTLSNKADVIPGDKFFTVISTYDEKHIFSKSNDVTIQTINK